VLISQYGDEISDQSFSFTILEPSEKEIVENDNQNENTEDWLNEEIEDTEENDGEELNQDEEKLSDVIETELATDVPNKKSMSDKDREGLAAMGGMETPKEKNVKPIAKFDKSKKVVAKIKEPKKEASIAERTDRFTIQITSKKILKDAQLFSQNLIGQGYDSYIQKVVFNTQDIWYRVRVGSYDNYNSAKNSADALSSEIGMATWVDFVRKEQ